MKYTPFKSFLSHRYEDADVNLYFFEIFKEIAEVQFEVDVKSGSTNVTRLEKMIREADTFIGIYPFSGTSDESHDVQLLNDKSKYFRLELDILTRSQKPAIIFYDVRFGDNIKPSSHILSCPFDINEVLGEGGYPSRNRHKKRFVELCEIVETRKKYEDTQGYIERESKALLVMPSQNNSILPDEDIYELRQILRTFNYDLNIAQFPLHLDSKLFNIIDKIDLAIVDHGGQVAASGLPAFFHGRFIPMIRIKHVTEVSKSGELEKFLFDGFEVGYKKDTIIWEDPADLKKSLCDKLERINSDKKLIKTYGQAKEYFNSAKLRKEVIFVSYSSMDKDVAKDIIAALKRNFERVFDYRDGQSIEGGQPWIAEIYKNISASTIGINLLSSSYLKSGHCLHEAQQMVSSLDSMKLKLFPIKLYDEVLDLPSFFESTQYLRNSDYSNVDELVKRIVKLSAK